MKEFIYTYKVRRFDKLNTRVKERAFDENLSDKELTQAIKDTDELLNLIDYLEQARKDYEQC